MAGVDDGEVPPVPIPNTEVKLTCAEDSWLETACENRQMPASLENSSLRAERKARPAVAFYAPLAQLVAFIASVKGVKTCLPEELLMINMR